MIPIFAHFSFGLLPGLRRVSSFLKVSSLLGTNFQLCKQEIIENTQKEERKKRKLLKVTTYSPPLRPKNYIKSTKPTYENDHNFVPFLSCPLFFLYNLRELQARLVFGI